jgi:hypothetical protein
MSKRSFLTGWSKVINESTKQHEREFKEFIDHHVDKDLLEKIAAYFYYEELKELGQPTNVDFKDLKEGRKYKFLKDALRAFEVYKTVLAILKKND